MSVILFKIPDYSRPNILLNPDLSVYQNLRDIFKPISEKDLVSWISSYKICSMSNKNGNPVGFRFTEADLHTPLKDLSIIHNKIEAVRPLRG